MPQLRHGRSEETVREEALPDGRAHGCASETNLVETIVVSEARR